MERSVEIEATSIASITLVNQLISTLMEKGVLTADEVRSTYASAIRANEGCRTAINDSAAYLLRRSHGLKAVE